MKCHKDTTSPTGLLSMVKSWLGVDFMETAWDGHEMRECRHVPSVGSLSIHWSGEMATQTLRTLEPPPPLPSYLAHTSRSCRADYFLHNQGRS